MDHKMPLSPTALAVLQSVWAGSRYGFDIMDATGLPGGTVYPVLSRLLDDELVTARWEDSRIAQREKRPTRRYYEITSDGEEILKRATAVQRAQERDKRRGRILRPAKAKA